MNWEGLFKIPQVGQNWQKRITLINGNRYRWVGTLNSEFRHEELTVGEKWAIILHKSLNKIVDLISRNETKEAKVLANLFSDLPIDIVLGEIDDCWYEKKYAEFNKAYPYSREYELARIRRQKLKDQFKDQFNKLRVGQVVNGVVRAVKPYGVFVDIGNLKTLLHVSMISHLPIEHPNQVFEVNDWIRALIVDINSERGRVTISTRELEPEPGDMLNNPSIVCDRAEEMGARYRKFVRQRMTLEPSD